MSPASPISTLHRDNSNFYMNHEQEPHLSASKAAGYFHQTPHNWNCAQSIHKAAQGRTGLSDEQIELSYRPKGGGRAEGGLCGAIYAVRSIIGEGSQAAEDATEEFRQTTSGLTCAELKGRCGRSCQELVAVAEQILQRHIDTEQDQEPAEQ